MEPKFETRTVTDRNLMKQMARYTCKSLRQRILMVLTVCVGLMLFRLYGSYLNPRIIRWAFSSDNSNGLSSFILAWIFLLFGALFILYPLYAPRIMARKYWSRFKHLAGSVNTNRFFDDYFASETQGSSSVAQYESIFEIVETKEAFGLKKDKLFGAVLPKSAFTIGSPDDFRAFIEGKTGKKVRFIR